MRKLLSTKKKKRIRWRLWEKQGGKCSCCGIKVIQPNQKNQNDPRRATINHIIPLSKGGEHDEKNLEMACQGCNYDLGDYYEDRERH